MRELQPVNQNVILKVEEQSGEQKTASGIIIPDTVENHYKITSLCRCEWHWIFTATGKLAIWVG